VLIPRVDHVFDADHAPRPLPHVELVWQEAAWRAGGQLRRFVAGLERELADEVSDAEARELLCDEGRAFAEQVAGHGEAGEDQVEVVALLEEFGDELDEEG